MSQLHTQLQLLNFAAILAASVSNYITPDKYEDVESLVAIIVDSVQDLAKGAGDFVDAIAEEVPVGLGLLEEVVSLDDLIEFASLVIDVVVEPDWQAGAAETARKDYQDPTVSTTNVIGAVVSAIVHAINPDEPDDADLFPPDADYDPEDVDPCEDDECMDVEVAETNDNMAKVPFDIKMKMITLLLVMIISVASHFLESTNEGESYALALLNAIRDFISN